MWTHPVKSVKYFEFVLLRSFFKMGANLSFIVSMRVELVLISYHWTNEAFYTCGWRGRTEWIYHYPAAASYCSK